MYGSTTYQGYAEAKLQGIDKHRDRHEYKHNVYEHNVYEQPAYEQPPAYEPPHTKMVCVKCPAGTFRCV